jgi:hypothetical protein
MASFTLQLLYLRGKSACMVSEGIRTNVNVIAGNRTLIAWSVASQLSILTITSGTPILTNVTLYMELGRHYHITTRIQVAF